MIVKYMNKYKKLLHIFLVSLIKCFLEQVMNIRLVWLSVLLFLSYAVQAVPVAPAVQLVAQPDNGVEINIRRWGDEYDNGWERINGYTVVKDSAAGIWFYAKQNAEGELITSNTRAEDAVPVNLDKHLRTKELPTTSSAVAEKSLSRFSSPSFVPGFVNTAGTVKIPVILANYSDTAFTNTAANFETAAVFVNAVSL